MRGSFSRDIIEGLLKPRGLLLLALTAAAAATAAWAAAPPFKIAAGAAVVLAALPALIVWGAIVGLSRRIESASQARDDLGWAVDGLHGRGQELGATARNLEAWCGQLAERTLRLEGAVSELQAAGSRGEELRLIVIDLAGVVQQLQSKLDPLASRGAVGDALGRIQSGSGREGGPPPAPSDGTDFASGPKLPVTVGGPLLHLETVQAEQALALQRIAGRLALVEDGLLAQAVTIENVVRGTNGADHAAG